MRTELLAALVWLAMTAALAGIAATEDGGAGCGATTTGSASNAGPVLYGATGLGPPAPVTSVSGGRTTAPARNLLAQTAPPAQAADPAPPEAPAEAASADVGVGAPPDATDAQEAAEALPEDDYRPGHDPAHSDAPPGPVLPAAGPVVDSGPGHLLPEDPFRRCAVKALRGDFGPLAEWQRVGYQQALTHQPVSARIWCTTYYSSEGAPRGSQTRWWGRGSGNPRNGYGCSERVASANELPAYAFVWTPETGIRQVLDTGADSNDRRARGREGAEHWCDFWEERKGSLFGDENGGTRRVWAVRGRQPARWKHRRAPAQAWLAY